MLDLVEDRRRADVLEEAARIRARPREHVRILQQVIGRARKEPPKTERLPGATRTGQDERGESPRGALERRPDLAWHRLHDEKSKLEL